jgi:hypothetical protein
MKPRSRVWLVFIGERVDGVYHDKEDARADANRFMASTGARWRGIDGRWPVWHCTCGSRLRVRLESRKLRRGIGGA